MSRGVLRCVTKPSKNAKVQPAKKDPKRQPA